MTERLQDTTVLITGGSAGIGRGVAAAFLAEGANVMITSRKAERCEEAVAALAPIGGTIDWRAGHVGNPEQGAAIMAETIQRFGSLDVLVNNAATNPHHGPTIDVDAGRLDKTYEVNLRGPLLWSQAAWRLWMADHGGSIINIASVGGYATSRDLGVYCMFKAALIHLTKQLGAELGPGTRVNCIAPGLIKTDFARALWEGDRGAEVASRYPLKRLGEPDEIAKAVEFIFENDYFNGRCIEVDGGLRL
jgi:NAD(P)-dependent dehydrogenase (short-subunit alcohol dehydrogenase family)